MLIILKLIGVLIGVDESCNRQCIDVTNVLIYIFELSVGICYCMKNYQNRLLSELHRTDV